MVTYTLNAALRMEGTDIQVTVVPVTYIPF